jgi:DNA-binding NtrC family response regulator
VDPGESSDLPQRELPWERGASRAAPRCLHLVLAWSLDEPERLGETIALSRRQCFGRGEPLADDPAPRALPHRMRPGANVPGAPVRNARIARLQLLLEPAGADAARIRSLGKAVLRVNGRATTEAVVQEGDVLELHNAAVFLVAERPLELPALRHPSRTDFPFGGADPFGIVGESAGLWALRDSLTFAASTERHVLILGESGTGKELAARALHGQSPRGARPLVARSAATLPESLIDAELFGNVRNYPNPGMPERPGLIGEADGSTLFLDEIGELPERSQVHLLRVLDAAGEYQRLGEARSRRSSFRLVAATNRSPEALKHDVLARFSHRVAIPGLTERREDVPLVLAELLRRLAGAHPQIADRFFERRQGQLAEPRLAPAFVVRLLRHAFTHHVRELERLLWLAIGTAEADYIGVTEAVEAELRDSAESSAAVLDVDREVLLRAIAHHGRSPTRLARELGLKNRYVLIRLLKKHGLSLGGEAEERAE